MLGRWCGALGYILVAHLNGSPGLDPKAEVCCETMLLDPSLHSVALHYVRPPRVFADKLGHCKGMIGTCAGHPADRGAADAGQLAVPPQLCWSGYHLAATTH